MHILASGPEYQAVYFGHVFHPDVKILPPTQERLTKEQLLSAYYDVFNVPVESVPGDVPICTPLRYCLPCGSRENSLIRVAGVFDNF